MRTNIDIDDKIIKSAMELAGVRTKKDMVDRALREFVARRTRKNLMDLWGKIKLADDYDYKALRRGKK